MVLGAVTGCGVDDNRARGVRARVDAGYRVEIHRPASLRGIVVADGGGGRPVEVMCASCHELFRDDPPRLPTRADELRGPHAGMRFTHGTVPCASCHDPSRYDGLRLASGEQVPMTEAMQLCRQCHGPQARDYDHGAHGGMRGHWDLSRGGRVRNHCVDCHDPHSPQFPRFRPMPPPRDTAGLRGGDHG